MHDSNQVKTVLVVDDEVHIVNVVAMKFRHEGFRVLTARGPQEAFDMAVQHVPDLIIADHQMPGGSGIDMCQQLRSTAATSDIPAILLTAYDFSIVQDAVSDSNIVDIMAKPFSPRELLCRAVHIMNAGAGQETT